MNGMSMPVGDLRPELVLLVGAVVVLLFALFAPRDKQRWAAGIAIVVLAVAVWTTGILLAGPERLTFYGTYAVDGAALWGKVIVLGTTAIVVMLSVEWFATDPRHGEYYAMLLLAALGAMLMAGAADLLELSLAVLLSSATAAILIAWHRTSRRASEAAIKFYLLGALTNAAMMYGIVLLFGLAAATTYTDLNVALGRASPTVLVAGTGLVLVGLAFKLGAVPAHAWLPDAADGAPAPVAAFVATVPKVGALIALARLMTVIPEDRSGWRVVVAVIAAATMTLGNVAALWQDDVRRLLGWSAVSQTGYGLLAVVAIGRSGLALPSLLFFLAAYALGNLAAFGVVVALRGLADRRSYAGLAARRPWLAFAMTPALLSFIGVPPLAGFPAKLTLLGAAIEAKYGWLAVVAVVNTVISVAYYVRVFVPMYFEQPASDAANADMPTLGPWAIGGACVAALGIVVLGVWSGPLVRGLGVATLLPH
jgi:NADH-quinone oxidoreductase subunit N